MLALLKYCTVQRNFVVVETAGARDYTSARLVWRRPALVLPALTTPDDCITKHRSSAPANGARLSHHCQYFPASSVAVEAELELLWPCFSGNVVPLGPTLYGLAAIRPPKGSVSYQCLI